ncbi:MAG: iron ABC transporter permease [Bacteroidales bacterium]|nr:iron ABC transporter permease [Bacteroidales bacterium]
MRKTRIVILAAILILLLVGAAICNIFFGAVHIPAADIWHSLTGAGDDVVSFIIRENRIPQCITATLGGAALAATGLLLQTAFRNPLAGPSVLGISSGASLGVAIVMLWISGPIVIGGSEIGGYAAIIGGALAGSLLITLLLTILSMRVRNALMLLIVGMFTGYLTSSLVTLLSSLADARKIQNYVFWGMGSFGGVPMGQLPWFSGLVIVGLILAMLLAKPLNLLLLGDNYATNLGVRVSRVKTQLLLVSGVLTAVVTAYCGPVAFIGLAMPHIARMLTRTDNHLILLPFSMLAGATTALICNLLSVLPGNTVIPLNALTPIIGVPVILYVIKNRS